MNRKKTFAEVIADGAEIYPSDVDPATRSVVFDWFQFRRVTDNEKFPVYFRRVMSRDYSRYKQLLRIEAGKQGNTGTITEFDWLVTDYLERYEKRDIDHTATGSTSGTSTGTNSGTTGVVHGGTTMTEAVGEESTTYGQTVNGTTSGTSSQTNSGRSENGTESEARAGALTRTQPMSAEYTQSDMDMNDSRRGYVHDTAKGINVGEKVYTDQDPIDDNTNFIVGLHRNFPELGIKNPTSASDSHTSTGTVGQTKETSTTAGTTGGTTSTEYGGEDTRADETTTTVTHGMTVDTEQSGSHSDTTTGSHTDRTAGTDTAETQQTGRGGQIAEILDKAQKYIRHSSAWDWLRGQLETCFMACID